MPEFVQPGAANTVTVTVPLPTAVAQRPRLPATARAAPSPPPQRRPQRTRARPPATAGESGVPAAILLPWRPDPVARSARRRYALSHDAAREALHQSPGLAGPLHVYADWLEEQGHPLGGLIRQAIAYGAHTAHRSHLVYGGHGVERRWWGTPEDVPPQYLGSSYQFGIDHHGSLPRQPHAVDSYGAHPMGGGYHRLIVGVMHSRSGTSHTDPILAVPQTHQELHAYADALHPHAPEVAARMHQYLDRHPPETPTRQSRCREIVTRLARRRYAQVRAPAGGIVVRGLAYPGGELLPREAQAQPLTSQRHYAAPDVPAEDAWEGPFHTALDQAPHNQQVRRDFADHLDERGDPRGEAFRWLADHDKHPQPWAMNHAGGVTAWYWPLRGGYTPYLPTALHSHLGNDLGDGPNPFVYRTRRLTEDRFAEAYHHAKAQGWNPYPDRPPQQYARRLARSESLSQGVARVRSCQSTQDQAPARQETCPEARETAPGGQVRRALCRLSRRFARGPEGSAETSDPRVIRRQYAESRGRLKGIFARLRQARRSPLTPATGDLAPTAEFTPPGSPRRDALVGPTQEPTRREITRGRDAVLHTFGPAPTPTWPTGTQQAHWPTQVPPVRRLQRPEEHEPFLQWIIADRDDPRRVAGYADWLSEQGHSVGDLLHFAMARGQVRVRPQPPLYYGSNIGVHQGMMLALATASNRRRQPFQAYIWPQTSEVKPTDPFGDRDDSRHPVLLIAEVPHHQAHALVAHLPESAREQGLAYLRQHGIRRPRIQRPPPEAPTQERRRESRVRRWMKNRVVRGFSTGGGEGGGNWVSPTAVTARKLARSNSGPPNCPRCGGNGQRIRDPHYKWGCVNCGGRYQPVPRGQRLGVPPYLAHGQRIMREQGQTVIARRQRRRYARPAPEQIHPDFRPGGIAGPLGQHLLEKADAGGEHAPFAHAILTHDHASVPHNPLNVYADWLDEQGQGQKGVNWRRVGRGLELDRFVASVYPGWRWGHDEPLLYNQPSRHGGGLRVWARVRQAANQQKLRLPPVLNLRTPRPGFREVFASVTRLNHAWQFGRHAADLADAEAGQDRYGQTPEEWRDQIQSNLRLLTPGSYHDEVPGFEAIRGHPQSYATTLTPSGRASYTHYPQWAESAARYRRGSLIARMQRRRYAMAGQEHVPFHQAILADPQNPQPALVYADWLGEQGDQLRAETIRRSIETPRRVSRLAGRYLHQPYKDFALPIPPLTIARRGKGSTYTATLGIPTPGQAHVIAPKLFQGVFGREELHHLIHTVPAVPGGATAQIGGMRGSLMADWERLHRDEHALMEVGDTLFPKLSNNLNWGNRTDDFRIRQTPRGLARDLSRILIMYPQGYPAHEAAARALTGDRQALLDLDAELRRDGFAGWADTMELRHAHELHTTPAAPVAEQRLPPQQYARVPQRRERTPTEYLDALAHREWRRLDRRRRDYHSPAQLPMRAKLRILRAGRASYGGDLSLADVEQAAQRLVQTVHTPPEVALETPQRQARMRGLVARFCRPSPRRRYAMVSDDQIHPDLRQTPVAHYLQHLAQTQPAHAPFVEAMLRQHPDQNLAEQPFGVYADWLAEQGSPDHEPYDWRNVARGATLDRVVRAVLARRSIPDWHARNVRGEEILAAARRGLKGVGVAEVHHALDRVAHQGNNRRWREEIPEHQALGNQHRVDLILSNLHAAALHPQQHEHGRALAYTHTLPNEPDWIEEFLTNGGQVDQKGVATMYKPTSAEHAARMVQAKTLSPEDHDDPTGMILSTHPDVRHDYGEGQVVQVRVPLHHLEPFDAFSGRRMDFLLKHPVHRGRGLSYRPFSVQHVAPPEEATT